MRGVIVKEREGRGRLVMLRSGKVSGTSFAGNDAEVGVWWG